MISMLLPGYKYKDLFNEHPKQIFIVLKAFIGQARSIRYIQVDKKDWSDMEIVVSRGVGGGTLNYSSYVLHGISGIPIIYFNFKQPPINIPWFWTLTLRH